MVTRKSAYLSADAAVGGSRRMGAAVGSQWEPGGTGRQGMRNVITSSSFPTGKPVKSIRSKDSSKQFSICGEKLVAMVVTEHVATPAPSVARAAQ